MSSKEKSLSSTSKVPGTVPANSSTSSEEMDDALLMQLMILDQQCKGIPGYVPKITDATRRPARLDAIIGNLFDGSQGRLVCDSCVDSMYKLDRSLWTDLKRHVHLSIPVHLRTGPDLYQCFCGYCSFRLDDLQHHLETTALESNESDLDQGEILAGLVRRIGCIDMHEDCQRKLVALINGEDSVDNEK